MKAPKPPEPPSQSEEFERFEAFAKALISVPKSEIDKKSQRIRTSKTTAEKEAEITYSKNFEESVNPLL